MQINLIHKKHILKHIQIGFIEDDYSIHYNNTTDVLNVICNSHSDVLNVICNSHYNKKSFKLEMLSDGFNHIKQIDITGQDMLKIFKQPYLAKQMLQIK